MCNSGGNEKDGSPAPRWYCRCVMYVNKQCDTIYALTFAGFNFRGSELNFVLFSCFSCVVVGS